MMTQETHRQYIDKRGYWICSKDQQTFESGLIKEHTSLYINFTTKKFKMLV